MATICGWFTPRMCKFHYKLYTYQAWSWFHPINANTIVGRRRKIEIGNSLDATQYCNPVWKFLIGLASCHQIPETALSSPALWATHIFIFHCCNVKQNVKGSWQSQERVSKTMWMGWDGILTIGTGFVQQLSLTVSAAFSKSLRRRYIHSPNITKPWTRMIWWWQSNNIFCGHVYFSRIILQSK